MQRGELFFEQLGASPAARGTSRGGQQGAWRIPHRTAVRVGPAQLGCPSPDSCPDLDPGVVLCNRGWLRWPLMSLCDTTSSQTVSYLPTFLFED